MPVMAFSGSILPKSLRLAAREVMAAMVVPWGAQSTQGPGGGPVMAVVMAAVLLGGTVVS